MPLGSSERLFPNLGNGNIEFFQIRPTFYCKFSQNVLHFLTKIVRVFFPLSRPISLTVAKCWDPSPRSYFTIPRGKSENNL